MGIKKKTINAPVDLDQLLDRLRDRDRLRDLYRLRDLDRLRDMDRLRSWARNWLMDRFWVKNIMDRVRFMEIMNGAPIMDRVLDLFRDMVRDLGMDEALGLGLGLVLGRVLQELNVSLKEADAKPAEPRDANGSEKLVYNNYVSFGTGKDGRKKDPDVRGDGLQTQSHTPVDECGLRLTKCDYLELEGGEMLSMKYLNAFSSMKFKGKLGSRDVVVLVDSGASSCFISSSIVAELNMPCDNSMRRGIQLGNGVWHEQRGICRNVNLELQGIQFTEDFLPFEMGDVDVILGVTWLKSLGPYLTDWNDLTMKFWRGDSLVCLSGDPSLSCLPASLHAIVAWRYLGVLVLGSISVLCSNQSPC